MGRDPLVFNVAENICLVIADQTNGLTTRWAESAAWMDDINGEGATYWKSWHFINKPINWDGRGFENPIKK